MRGRRYSLEVRPRDRPAQTVGARGVAPPWLGCVHGAHASPSVRGRHRTSAEAGGGPALAAPRRTRATRDGDARRLYEGDTANDRTRAGNGRREAPTCTKAVRLKRAPST